jgi:hypothetical protein
MSTKSGSAKGFSGARTTKRFFAKGFFAAGIPAAARATEFIAWGAAAELLGPAMLLRFSRRMEESRAWVGDGFQRKIIGIFGFEAIRRRRAARARAVLAVAAAMPAAGGGGLITKGWPAGTLLDKRSRLRRNRCGLSGHERGTRLRFYFQLPAKLLYFFFDQHPVAALRNAFEIQRAEGDALQFFDGMFFREEHAAENIFFGILQGDFVPEIFGVAAGGVGLAHGANGRTGIAAEAFELVHQQAALNFNVVALLEIGPVFQHFRGEVAVVS